MQNLPHPLVTYYVQENVPSPKRIYNNEKKGNYRKEKLYHLRYLGGREISILFPVYGNINLALTQKKSQYPSVC